MTRWERGDYSGTIGNQEKKSEAQGKHFDCLIDPRKFAAGTLVLFLFDGRFRKNTINEYIEADRYHSGSSVKKVSPPVEDFEDAIEYA